MYGVVVVYVLVYSLECTFWCIRQVRWVIMYVVR